MFLCFVRRTDPLLVCHVFFYLCGGVTMTQTEEHVYVFCEPYWPPACLSCVLLFAWWCHNDANRGACVCVLCAILTPCLFVMCSSICVVVSPRHKQRSWWQTSRGLSLAQKTQMCVYGCMDVHCFSCLCAFNNCWELSPRHKQRSWWQASRGSSLAQNMKMFLYGCMTVHCFSCLCAPNDCWELSPRHKQRSWWQASRG